MDRTAGFAEVYDVIYDGPPAFIEAQVAFLTARLGPAPAVLLDAGCGTGRHVAALGARGYTVIGVDAGPAMLAVAHGRLSEVSLPARLAAADLRGLPFGSGEFSGAFCLESPLAYLLHGDELASALAGFWRVLQPGGRLVVDIFDYAGTLGPDGAGPQTVCFPAAWGTVEVVEDHRCDAEAGLWWMRQAFTLYKQKGARRFTIVHIFALRTADDYAAALEKVGFTIEDLMAQYPATPAELAGERRMIFVATRR